MVLFRENCPPPGEALESSYRQAFGKDDIAVLMEE
jgi:hypothetical protein